MSAHFESDLHDVSLQTLQRYVEEAHGRKIKAELAHKAARCVELSLRTNLACRQLRAKNIRYNYPYWCSEVEVPACQGLPATRGVCLGVSPDNWRHEVHVWIWPFTKNGKLSATIEKYGVWVIDRLKVLRTGEFPKSRQGRKTLLEIKERYGWENAG